MSNYSEKYLFDGSPFLLPPLSFRAVMSIRANIGIGLPPPLAVAQDLVEEFRKHFDYLKSNDVDLAKFGTTLESLDLYKLGFLAPLIIIRISIEDEARPGVRDGLLPSIQYLWDYSEHYASFLSSNIDKCTQLRANGYWRRIFQLASTYDRSDYYQIGSIASEVAFRQIIQQ